ncbi:hypothetical protein WG66_001592, partial [Moniliophthora roreri]
MERDTLSGTCRPPTTKRQHAFVHLIRPGAMHTPTFDQYHHHHYHHHYHHYLELHAPWIY